MDITPAVKDATEAIDHIPLLVEAFSRLLATPTGWVVLVAVFLWFVVNRKLYTVFDSEKRLRARLEQLDGYLAKPEIADPDSVAVVRDLRDAHYFRIATGIYAEKRLRKSLIWLHDETPHLINWKQIHRALPYIKPTAKGTATIRDLTAWERIGYIYNEVVAYASLLAAAGMFALLLLSGARSILVVALTVAGAIIAFALAMFAFSQNLPERNARRIKAELEATTSPAPDA